MFEWDEYNTEHIASHEVEPDEVEEAFIDPRRFIHIVGGRRGERRWALYGKTYNGRILVIIYTRRGGRLRVVTARDAGSDDKRTYRSRGK